MPGEESTPVTSSSLSRRGRATRPVPTPTSTSRWIPQRRRVEAIASTTGAGNGSRVASYTVEISSNSAAARLAGMLTSHDAPILGPTAFRPHPLRVGSRDPGPFALGESLGTRKRGPGPLPDATTVGDPSSAQHGAHQEDPGSVLPKVFG